MSKNWMIGMLAATMLAGSACGDDEPKADPNNTTANNTTANNTTMNNTTVNNTTVNNTTANNGGIAVDVNEVEPNGYGENDTPTPFELGQSVGGTITEGSGEMSDFDRFSFTAEAGQIVTIELLAAGEGLMDLGANQAYLAVLNEDQSFVRELLTAEGLTSRELFIPETGTYTLEVFDERAFGEEASVHGGPDATYVVSTSVSAPEPADLPVPGTVDGDQSDGTIDTYTFTPAELSIVELETFAQRLDTPSGLDTILLVWDRTNQAVVAANDDAFATAENMVFDSAVTFPAEAATEYLVVVDAYAPSTSGAFRLEAEPVDDALSAPTEIAVDTTTTGDIGEADGTEFDTDFFELTLERNQVARVVVTASDQLQPNLQALFGGQPFAEARPVDGVAALEIAAGDFEDPQTFIITVDDIRNRPDEADPELVGGAGFGYEVNVTSVTWTPTAVTLPASETGAIDPLGTTDWYSFDVAAGDVLVADVITTSTEFLPRLVVLTETLFDVPVPTPYFVNATEQTTVTIGVRDEFFRGGPAYDYLIDFTAVTPPVVVEAEPNDTVADAESPTRPVRLTGVLDGTGPAMPSPDLITFTASAGDVVFMTTGPGPDETTEDADTVLTLFDAAEMELASNDDIAAGNTFSVLQYEITADGTYTLQVTPYCGMTSCTGNGDYSVTIVTN